MTYASYDTTENVALRRRAAAHRADRRATRKARQERQARAAATDVAKLAGIVRHETTHILGIERRKATGHAGHTRATTIALSSRSHRRLEAIDRLVDLDPRLAGMLHAECDLRKRLLANRLAGVDRPELQARLNQVRRNVKTRIKEAQPR